MSKYPEHEKLKKISDKSQSIVEFLLWLKDNRNVILISTAEFIVRGSEYKVQRALGSLNAPQNGRLWIMANTEGQYIDLVAEFFDIDRDLLEKEKIQMLEDIRKAQTEGV